jgi:hypothetical protein
MPEYEVKQNEDIVSIVFRECGTTDITTVISHQDNQKLLCTRTAEILCPGDKLWLPEIGAGIPLSVKKGRGYIIKPRGGLRKIAIRIESKNKQPIKNTPYKLTVGGRILEGSTDGNGILKQQVPLTATKGRLDIGNFSFKLELAALDPIQTLTGIQGRLANLGYYRGAIDGEIGPVTKRAIMRFQSDSKITVDGRVGPETRKKLLERHGC